MPAMLSTISCAATKTQRTSISPFAHRPSMGRTPYGLPVTSTCLSEALRQAGGDGSFSEESLEELDRISHVTSYPQGALLFVEGQSSRGVYVLCQGRVKLSTTNRAGKTMIMKIAVPGDILGLHEAVSARDYELSAETLQPSQFAFISREDFARFLRNHADACLQVTLQLGKDCQSAYDIVRSIGLSHSVTEKLARLLLQWSSDGQPVGGAIRLKVTLTHEEIAQLIGSTRETVTRILSELKKKNVLEIAGSSLLIRNKAALEEMIV